MKKKGKQLELELERGKKFEKNWEKRYTQLCLDRESNEPTFLIVTPDELEVLKDNTKDRVKEYNRIKPQGWATYE